MFTKKRQWIVRQKLEYHKNILNENTPDIELYVFNI